MIKEVLYQHILLNLGPRFIYDYKRKEREIKIKHSALEKGVGE